MADSAAEVRARLASRRRAVLAVLRLAEQVSGYAAGQVADGAGPVEAWRAAVEAQAALAGLAGALARLTVLEPGERRALALELVSAGAGTREVADQLDLAAETVRKFSRQASRQVG